MFDVSLFRSIGGVLNIIMITASPAGDYQHTAEELVSIEGKGLSVFVLHAPSSCPYPLLFVSVTLAASVLTRACAKGR